MPYDSSNFTPSTCKNKGIPMYFHKLNTTGILTGYYTSEILETVISTTTQTSLANWIAFDTYIKANPFINLSFTLNLWKVARMGGCGNDGVHLNPGGVILAAGYVLKGLRGLLPQFANLFSNNFDWWEDPDYLFSQLLTPSSDGYVPSGDVTSENQNILSGGFLRLTTWYLPLPAQLTVTTNLTDSGSAIFFWNITGADHSKAVKVSVNGGAFSSSIATTNGLGNAGAYSSGADTVGLSVGSNTLRYAVGNICLDPTTIDYGPQSIIWSSLSLVNSWAAVSPGTYSPPASNLTQFKTVRLRGVISGGTSGTQFTTLPAGHRPPYTIFLTTSAAGVISYIQINPSGACFVTGGVTNVALDGLTFSTL